MTNNGTSLKRNPEATKQKILDWATRCFAKNGFHGTTVDEIIAKAKVNKRMVYHYFEDKKELYRAIQLNEWQKLQKWFLKKLNPSVAEKSKKHPKTILIEALTAYYDFVANHQLYLRLQIWEGIEGGEVSREIWEDMRGPIYRQIEAFVLAVQKQGGLSKKIKANHLIMFFLGSISYYFFHAHTMGTIFNAKPLSTKAVQEHKEQTIEILKALLASK